jgi:hypothetical protein
MSEPTTRPQPEPGDAILAQIERGEGDATPWDELKIDWGPWRRDPLHAIREALNWDKMMGTW